MNDLFQDFHCKAAGQFYPNDLSREANVTKDFAKLLIKEFPQYPTKLLNRFSMGRTNIRRRHLSTEIQRKESLRSKRKKQEMSYSAPAKKSKKATTTQKKTKKSTTSAPVVESSSDSYSDSDPDSEWEHEIDERIAEIRKKSSEIE